MCIPKIIVKKVDYDYNVKYITDLLTPKQGIQNTSLPFLDRVYGLIPQLKAKIKDGMIYEEIYNEVNLIVKEILIQNSEDIDKRVNYIQREFDKLSYPLMKNMLQLFETEWNEKDSNIICYLGCFPVFPRDVIKKEFYVNYNTIDERIMKSSIHEIDHFVLFEKWKSMHGYYLKTQPKHPEALWFLEEIAVDPTLNEECIQKIAPYTQVAYQQFYNETINGISVMDNIKIIYNQKRNMADFLDRAYKFIGDNIYEIIKKCG